MKSHTMRMLPATLLAVLMLPGLSALPVLAQDTSQTFPETGHTVKGRFLQYWQAHGGLAQQGYPISEEMQEVSDTDGKTYTVQYFERAVFEAHPENAAPNDVLLSLLGVFLYEQKYSNAGAPDQIADNSPGSILFAETGKQAGGKFLDYWQTHGGLAQQGYPISDTFTEVSDLNGKPYTVQYFQRAVFEYHPENAAPYDVLLSQLGTFRNRARYSAGGGLPQPPVSASPPPVSSPLPSTEPPATPVPPQPTPQTTGTYSANASVSVADPTPSQNTLQTVTGTLLKDGKPVEGAQMNTTWHYKTTDSHCSAVTDANGTASCSRDISRATIGFTVRIDVEFVAPDGTKVTTSTSFTPR